MFSFRKRYETQRPVSAQWIVRNTKGNPIPIDSLEEMHRDRLNRIITNPMDQLKTVARLQKHYSSISDDELLSLSRESHDLTVTAQDLLGAELIHRGLNAEPDALPATILDAASHGDAPGDWIAPVEGAILLISFFDAVRARQACAHLERSGVALELRDRSVSLRRFRLQAGAPTFVLEIYVQPRDKARGIAVLRAEMGLFPLAEVTAEAEDDSAVSPIGYFAAREDSEKIARIMDYAGILHRTVSNPDGTLETEDIYMLQVREIDLEMATRSVESAMEQAELSS